LTIDICPPFLSRIPPPLNSRYRRLPIPKPESVMARVSYVEESAHPELADLIAKIRSGRRGALINVYRLLLHTPGIAAIWLDLVNAARFATTLDGRLREIVIVRVAHLNRTPYVLKQHVRSCRRRRD
jgi:alkylhydroperoxidase family enzyme